ncbi:MAG: type II secretion system protein [Sarcina sp.]
MINKKKKKGFTLIELVIVLAVLAIIALIAIPNFTKVRNDSLKKADTRTEEQIEKITLMAIANEDIIGAGTLKITGPKTIDSSSTVGFETTNGKTNYEKMLSEVEKPQQKGLTYFFVTVNDDMSVTVSAQGTATPPSPSK